MSRVTAQAVAAFSRAAASVPAVGRQPWIAVGVGACVVGIEVDEAALDEEVAHLEDVAPAARVGHAGAPGAVLVLAVARALAGERVATAHDPVEVGVVVPDALQGPADVGEALSDRLLAVGQPPLGEVDLRVVGEEVEDARPGRRDAAVVEGLQVLERDRLALLVRHRLLSDRHDPPPGFRGRRLFHPCSRPVDQQRPWRTREGCGAARRPPSEDPGPLSRSEVRLTPRRDV